VDLSAFIFVALAVAWAVYLVPKALKHHDDVVRSRSVDRFSHTMRVLARREPVNRRNARLVVTPGRPASAPVVTAKGAEPTPARAAVPAPVRREAARGSAGGAARGAARRRRNVLAVVLLANLVVLGVAAFGVIGWAWTAVPGGLLVAWLVACRLMVKQERAAGTASVRVPVAVEPEETVAEPAEEPDEVSADTSTMAAVALPVAVDPTIDPTLWDPVPVTLPTYVTKPAATRRTVRTIALDDSGVWTSGRTEADSQIAREAHAADREARESRKQSADDNRAVGS
jgi:hypothetical protein